MVGADDDGDLVGDAEIGDGLTQPAEVMIPVHDRPVVPVHQVLEVGAGADLLGHVVRYPGGAPFTAEVVQVQRGAGSVDVGVAVDDVLGGPLGWRAAGRCAVGPFLRLQVIGVRIPVGQVQVPVVAVLVALEPVDGDVGDQFTGLVAHVRVGLDVLLEVAHEEVRAVSLGERGHRRGVVAVHLQQLTEQGTSGLRHVTGVQPEPGRLTGVADNPVGDAELAAGERGAGRQAGGVGAVVAVETDAVLRHLVQVGGGGSLVAVGAGVVRPEACRHRRK